MTKRAKCKARLHTEPYYDRGGHPRTKQPLCGKPAKVVDTVYDDTPYCADHAHLAESPRVIDPQEGD